MDDPVVGYCYTCRDKGPCHDDPACQLVHAPILCQSELTEHEGHDIRPMGKRGRKAEGGIVFFAHAEPADDAADERGTL